MHVFQLLTSCFAKAENGSMLGTDVKVISGIVKWILYINLDNLNKKDTQL